MHGHLISRGQIRKLNCNTGSIASYNPTERVGAGKARQIIDTLGWENQSFNPLPQSAIGHGLP